MNQQLYKKRLQYQIAFYFILLVIFIINSVGWFLYFRAKNYFDEELGKKLIGITQFSTNLVEPDLLNYLQPGDENGDFYQTLQNNFLPLKRDFNVNRVYIVDTTFAVLVDTQPGITIGSTIPYLQSSLIELQTALSGTAQFSTLYRGNDGNLYKSAFAPIYTKSGKITAIACVDASPEFLQVMDKIKGSIIFINTVSLLLAIILGIFIAKSIVNPVNKLVAAARRVSTGDYSQNVNIPTKNEIGYLGQVFNAMQQNIKINQEKLHTLKQLAEARADTLQSYNDYILHSIGNGILTINLENEITVINPEAARILKLNIQESIGKNWEDSIEGHHPFHPFLKKIVEKEPHSYVIEIQLNYSESRITVGIHVSPLLDAERRVIGTNFVLTDQTELRKLQEQIKEKERLAYLGELSAAVAHEIRNPLNSIELFIGLLKRHTSPESKQIQNIIKIQNEIQALNTIVTDFLRFARQPQLLYREVSVAELFQETLQLAEKELKEKNISVRLNLSKNNLVIKGDFMQLKQALLNIVLNGIQAMDKNGRLTISASATDANRLSIEISDTGSGISEVNLAKIFDPFYSTRSQGTGLGLAIVQNIIQAHHGTIFVRSKINKGTTVSLQLPGKQE